MIKYVKRQKRAILNHYLSQKTLFPYKNKNCINVRKKLILNNLKIVSIQTQTFTHNKKKKKIQSVIVITDSWKKWLIYKLIFKI